MRKHVRAQLVATGQEISLRPGVTALSADVPDAAPSAKCFLCTAPNPRTHKDGCDAYLSGFVHAIMSLANGERPVELCKQHEVQLREMLVVKVQDASVYEKLGIETVTT